MLQSRENVTLFYDLLLFLIEFLFFVNNGVIEQEIGIEMLRYRLSKFGTTHVY